MLVDWNPSLPTNWQDFGRSRSRPAAAASLSPAIAPCSIAPICGSARPSASSCPSSKRRSTSSDELYEAVRTMDWSQFMTPDHTLAVDANVRDSAITHSQYAARRVKDAICDQFRERTGVRPSVDTERPMIGLNLHIYRNQATLSLDSSGDSLHKRGYRPVQTIAPLNEALAAALILRSGWRGEAPFVDPLCGSGTLPIEAAWIAIRRPPGLTRKHFGFMGWMDSTCELWTAIRDEARRDVRQGARAPDRRLGLSGAT